jgi:hypothetical protein
MGSGTPPWLPHVLTLIANFAMAYVIGWTKLATRPQTLGRGLQIAAVLWVGIAASVFATELVFEARSLQFFGIVAGSPLIGMLVMGIGSDRSSHFRNDNATAADVCVASAQ